MHERNFCVHDIQGDLVLISSNYKMTMIAPPKTPSNAIRIPMQTQLVQTHHSIPPQLPASSSDTAQVRETGDSSDVLSKVETDFLHDAVSQDDAEMYARIYAVQDRYEDTLRTQM